MRIHPNHQPPTTNHQPPTTNHQPPTTNHQPPTTMSKRKKQIDKMGPPLKDIYCRGCHARPSHKNINTYYCAACWNRWNLLRRSAEVLDDSEVDAYKESLIAFITSRGRYVWPSEAYLYHRPVSIKELKRCNIKVATICRDLRRFAPADDRITRENAQRVRDFVMEYVKSHGKTPSVREAIDGVGMEHTTLWSCIDYEKLIGDLGGKIPTDGRYRFRDHEEFLQAAAGVVREADCPLHMTVILEELGMSYPTYLENYQSVRPEDIHDAAGVSRAHEGVASMFEAAARKALNELGWDLQHQASFPDLVGGGGGLLHFDFRLAGTTTLVEIDGDQHYNTENFMYDPSMKINDDRKDEYAKRNGYPLIRVDTRIYKSPKAMKEFLLPLVGLGPRGPLNPSNALNTTGPARRGIVRGETRDRPGPR